ncbi:Membrane protein involved in the export of O-antigen, teichoic acid lipoteichoic acids [Vibrio chagasii]|nr:Membrane protein involved in the export of O-antigen, teichoic acid lipoteichoic acids [Vibrio chagasii]CAH7427700.1 Membrane protein involved in the export of O-antigen, teichoic acid lipoteichoic acids [Vibrio chagasii]
MKNIIKNFGFLSLLQIVSLLIPFLIYPYLIRIYGSSLYGEYIYALVISSLFQVVINFGFDLSGTKEISERINKGKDISTVFCAIQAIKFFISILSVLTLILFVKYLNLNIALYALCIVFVVFESLFPIYVFNGLEKQKIAAFIQIPSKILYLSLVYMFISNQESINNVVVLQIISSFIALVVAHIYLNKVVGIKLVTKLGKISKYLFFDSWIYFVSRISGVINLKTASLTLGYIFSPSIVAMYDLSMKFVDLFRMPITIINQVIYPKVIKSRDKNLVIIILLLCIFYSLGVCFFVYIFGMDMVMFLGGKEMAQSNMILQFIIFLVPLSAISWVLGNNALIAFGYKKLFLKSVLYSSLFLVICSLYLVVSKEDVVVEDVLEVVVMTAILLACFRLYYSIKVHFFGNCRE